MVCRFCLLYTSGKQLVWVAEYNKILTCWCQNRKPDAKDVEYQADNSIDTVSYTHLDVYKRQNVMCFIINGYEKKFGLFSLNPCINAFKIV